MHIPQPAAVVTGAPFTASTEYDTQYVPKPLNFNQIGSHGSHGAMGKSNGQIHKLPTISSETTNQHFYPSWGMPPPQKKGYAVRAMSAAPPLDFAGDTFTTTNAVEYQPKPSSYVRPTGRASQATMASEAASLVNLVDTQHVMSAPDLSVCQISGNRCSCGGPAKAFCSLHVPATFHQPHFQCHYLMNSCAKPSCP